MAKIANDPEKRKILIDKFMQIIDVIDESARKPGGLPDLDAIVREQVLGLGQEMLAQTLAAIGTELAQRAAECLCPKCSNPLRFKQYRRTSVVPAITGERLDVSAPLAVCPNGCPVAMNLLRRKMVLDADGRTPKLRELATLAGTVEPFEAAATDLLGAMAGISMSANGIHGICQEEAEYAATLLETGRLAQTRTLAKGEVLYVMADGCMVWVDDAWREVKLAVIFPSFSNAEVSFDRRMTLERQVVCTLGSVDDLGDLIEAAVMKWLPRGKDGAHIIRGKVVFLADGADWLRILAEVRLPGATILLDWYHMAEHVAKAANVLFSNTNEAEKWRKDIEKDMRFGEVHRALYKIHSCAKAADTSTAARDELLNLHGYLHKRRHHLRYAEARAKGLLIGSGPVESAANHVVQQRMKRAGMRWYKNGADAMLVLRAAHRSTGGFRSMRRETLAA